MGQNLPLTGADITQCRTQRLTKGASHGRTVATESSVSVYVLQLKPENWHCKNECLKKRLEKGGRSDSGWNIRPTQQQDSAMHSKLIRLNQEKRPELNNRLSCDNGLPCRGKWTFQIGKLHGKNNWQLIMTWKLLDRRSMESDRFKKTDLSLHVSKSELHNAAATMICTLGNGHYSRRPRKDLSLLQRQNGSPFRGRKKEMRDKTEKRIVR